MSVLGWLQAAFDVAAVLAICFHPHSIIWRPRR